MAIQDQTTDPPHRGRRHVHRRRCSARTSQMAGPVADGGHIVWNSTPGCWGPMITPAIRGGHEVCTPVAVEGAEVGDAIAIRIKDIAVTSQATSSGNDQAMEGRFNGDPYCAAVCPGCGAEWPETRLEGIGETAVRCAACGADATPFTFTNGYTVAFDGQLGLTVDEARARGARARRRPRPPRCPDNSVQNPILTFAPHDIVGLVTRMRPFLGQLGTTPSTTMPDSHNAGDFGAFLVGAPHKFALDAAGAAAAQDRRPPGHRRRARGRDPRLPGQGRRAAASTSATCTRCRATARSPATPPTSRARSRCRSRSSRGSGSTGRCCSRSPRTCRSWPSR